MLFIPEVNGAPLGPRVLCRFAQLISLSACFLAPTLIMAAVPGIWESRGRLKLERYGHNGEVFDACEHDCSLTNSDQVFRIRAMTSWEGCEQGMVAMSDGKSIYTSTQLSTISGGQKTGTAASARFEPRKMPSSAVYGWGGMQGLSLSMYLLRDQRSAVVNNELKPEFIPDVISVRAREQRVPQVRTQCFTDERGMIRKILFWGVRAGLEHVELSSTSKDCFELGELRIDGSDQGVPTKVYFVINGVFKASPDPTQRPVPSPLNSITFEGTVSPQNAAVFKEISFQAGGTLYAKDFRFSPRPPISYPLREGEALPFDFSLNSQTPNVAQRAYAAKVGTVRATHSKRRVILATLGATIILGTTIFIRSRRHSKNTSHKIS